MTGLAADFALARELVEHAARVLARLPALPAGHPALTMLRHNFGIGRETASLVRLQARFAALRAQIADPVPVVAEAGPGPDAFVVTPDPTLHLCPNYFRKSAEERAATLLHERAHIILHGTGHPGMGVDFDLARVRPETDKRPLFTRPAAFFEDAIRNPYCYEWFALAVWIRKPLAAAEAENRS